MPDLDDSYFVEPTDSFDQEPPPQHQCPGCPVYVMLPLDTVWVVERDGRSQSVLKKERSLEIALHTLKQVGGLRGQGGEVEQGRGGRRSGAGCALVCLGWGTLEGGPPDACV